MIARLACFAALSALCCGPAQAGIDVAPVPYSFTADPVAQAALAATQAAAAAAAPVQSVNKLTGAVTVPGTMRATCSISAFDNTGTGSCAYSGFTGGSTFTQAPDCFLELTSTATGYVYAFPVVAESVSTVSVTEQAAAKVLNISLGALTIWGAPPTGTVIKAVCKGN